MRAPLPQRRGPLPCSRRARTQVLHDRHSRATTANRDSPKDHPLPPSPIGIMMPARAVRRRTLQIRVRVKNRGSPRPRRPRALVAQGIEHRFPKPCVAGSNPAGGTLKTQVRASTRVDRAKVNNLSAAVWPRVVGTRARGRVETFGNGVELVAEQVPVPVECERRGCVAEHRLHAFHGRACSDCEDAAV